MQAQQREHERFLHRIGRVLAAAEHPQRVSVKRRPVPVQQHAQRWAVAAARSPHQLSVGRQLIRSPACHHAYKMRPQPKKFDPARPLGAMTNNLMDLDVDDVAARCRALALETRARGTATRAQAWCMPTADRDDAMPFPSSNPDDDTSAVEHRDNLHKCKPRWAEGSGCWRFAEPARPRPTATVGLQRPGRLISE